MNFMRMFNTDILREQIKRVEATRELEPALIGFHTTGTGRVRAWVQGENQMDVRANMEAFGSNQYEALGKLLEANQEYFRVVIED